MWNLQERAGAYVGTSISNFCLLAKSFSSMIFLGRGSRRGLLGFDLRSELGLGLEGGSGLGLEAGEMGF